MLTLHATPESLYCAKLRILLRHKGLDWTEIVPEGGCGSERFRRRVPAGTLPAIADGELLLADSEAIAEYLEETHPTPAMLPRTPAARARCRERSRFHDTRLEPELRRLFPEIGKAARDAGAIAGQEAMLTRRLRELAGLLAADDTRDPAFLSLADCGFPVTFAWIDAFAPVLGMAVDWPETVRDYRSVLEAHRAVAEELSAYAPAMDAWLQSKTG